MTDSENQKYPANLKNNLFNEFIENVENRIVEEDLSAFDAISFYCMDIFGLEHEEDASRSDGTGDRGIDYYRVQKSSVDVWQFKGVENVEMDSFSKKAQPKDLSDLRRIVEYIHTIHEQKLQQNRRVRKFQNKLRIALENLGEEEAPIFSVRVNYCLANWQLTDQAKDELNQIKQAAASIEQIGNVLIEVNIKVTLLDGVLAEIWRTENDKWTGKNRKKADWVDLTYDSKEIDDGKCRIFFCKAIDLINAYNSLGQRLFAPNVRCYLKDTPVNSRIKDAVSTVKGMDNFRYFNNGVTILAEAIEKKQGAVSIRKPGVINGLQTIKALSEAYEVMDSSKRELLREKVYVLTRVFAGKKHSFQTEDLVVATNNQNKMDPRNLRSNTQTQKHLEREMAKLNWFYERKERAWDAFSESDGNWDNLPGLKAVAFGGNTKANRRSVDNQVVATSWLAFSGYSEIARQKKSRLFAEDKMYSRIFEFVPSKHGFEYDYRSDGPISDDSSQDMVPPASNLLLATLIYQTAKNCSQSSAELAKEFIEREKLQGVGIDEQKAELSKMPEFLARQMMVSSPLQFTELFGFMFFKIPLEARDKAAKQILSETDLAPIFQNKSYGEIKSDLSRTPLKNDFVLATYQMWHSILSELAEASAFRTELNNSSSRPSFTHRNETRRKVVGRLLELDNAIERRGSLDKPWSLPFDERRTVSNSLRQFAIS